MNLNTVLARLPVWFAAATDEAKPDRLRCFYLRSAPGRGKTTVFRDAPKLLSEKLGKNYGGVIVNGANVTPPDILGYMIARTRNGREVSVFTEPFFFTTDEGKHLSEYDGGIIVVDEADKMDVDLKKAIGEGALSGRIGPHRLPRGWVIWMCGNRMSDRSGSTKELDHLINRMCQIEITDDIVSWTDWAVTHGVSPLTIAFTNQYPQIVFTDGVPEKQGPWPTPRSVVLADSYLQTLAEHNGGTLPQNDPAMVEELSGTIGAGAAAQLMAFIVLEQSMPRFADIVADPTGVPVPDAPDAQMLVCYNLAHRVSMDTIGAVITYVERMPKEFAVTFVASAVKRIPAMVHEPRLKKWVASNASLIAVLNR